MNKKRVVIIAIFVFILIACGTVIWGFDFKKMPPTVPALNSSSTAQQNPISTPAIPRTNTYAINLPNELMLVDAQGRRTGKDPATGTYYHEIPGTGYSEDRLSPDHGSAQLTLFEPADGHFTLYILGAQSGQYRLDSWIDDGGPTPPVPQRISGNIQKGTMVSYVQDYDISNIASSNLSFSGELGSTASITSVPPHNLP